MPDPIYVELQIHADLDAVWDATQRPERHQRWDLRFTRIEYLPRPDQSEPQRFLYATRVGFGLRIEGRGESTGEREVDGTRTSALKFWSADRRSLIREGSGYWKYVPGDGLVRFITWYDYRTRFGAAGALADRVAFRPLLGWATAWSFDRLRLWLEDGVSPRVSASFAISHAISRVAIATVWLFHGIVPKLLYPSTGEAELLASSGVLSLRDAAAILPFIGLAEIAFGIVVLVMWRSVVPLRLNAIAALGLAAAVAITSPATLTAPFEPLTLGIALAALSLVGIRAGPFVPSAGRCLRRAPR